MSYKFYKRKTCKCYFIWKSRFADVIKNLKRKRLLWIIWESSNDSVLIRERHKEIMQTEEEKAVWRKRHRPEWWSHKAAPRRLKKLAADLPLVPVKGLRPGWHLDFNPLIWILDLWPPERWENKFQFFNVTTFVIICYSSHEKLMKGKMGGRQKIVISTGNKKTEMKIIFKWSLYRYPPVQLIRQFTKMVHLQIKRQN